jgi:hypothetical protein
MSLLNIEQQTNNMKKEKKTDMSESVSHNPTKNVYISSISLNPLSDIELQDKNKDEVIINIITSIKKRGREKTKNVVSVADAVVFTLSALSHSSFSATTGLCKQKISPTKWLLYGGIFRFGTNWKASNVETTFEEYSILSISGFNKEEEEEILDRILNEGSKKPLDF